MTLLSMNGICWPTKSLPVSLSSMLICGEARTVASVVVFRNWMRKSMLIVASRVPESSEFLDQFQYLGEEVDVCREQHGIATMIGDRAHAAHKITDDAGGAPAIGGARVIRRAAEPGKVTLFFDFLLQAKVALGRVVFLVLLLVLLRRLGIALPLLTGLADSGRAVLCKQDVDAVGHGNRFGKSQLHAQR